MKGKSIGSLVCGILSIEGGAIPFSIIALVLASQVLNDPNADAGARGRAKAGKITGIVGIVSTVIICIIVSIVTAVTAKYTGMY